MFQTILKTENSPKAVEQTLNHYKDVVFPFYLEKGKEVCIEAEKAKLSCRAYAHPNAKATILIVNGYNESYLKYAEVIYDLYQKEYSVYVYDHRGQGFSEKFPNQNQRGFIHKFSELVSDLEIFYKFVEQQTNKQDIYVIAHSMGGAVATLAVEQNKITPKKLVLSAPMFGIKLTPFPILENSVYLVTKLIIACGFQHSYAFGQKACFPLDSFEKNVVTHSKARLQIWQKHIKEVEAVQLGGPTFQWIKESIKASQCARNANLTTKNISILLLQPENEMLVRNDTQEHFVKNNKQCVQKISIPFARHEILMEIDTIRNQVFNDIFGFF